MRKDTIIGLIPARSGSKRVPGKNMRVLMGKPLIAWTIQSARASGIFTEIVVSTDSAEIIEAAESYGAAAILRPPEISGDMATDYEWLVHARVTLGISEDAFCILRPTSPFRQPETIQECWNLFQQDEDAMSLRTIRPVNEHPHKTWFYDRNQHYILPFKDLWSTDQPTQRLKTSYIQDGLLYINMTHCLDAKDSISLSYPVLPYITKHPENMDINTEYDFELANLQAYMEQKAGGKMVVNMSDPDNIFSYLVDKPKGREDA